MHQADKPNPASRPHQGLTHTVHAPQSRPTGALPVLIPFFVCVHCIARMQCSWGIMRRVRTEPLPPFSPPSSYPEPLVPDPDALHSPTSCRCSWGLGRTTSLRASMWTPPPWTNQRLTRRCRRMAWLACAASWSAASRVGAGGQRGRGGGWRVGERRASVGKS